MNWKEIQDKYPKVYNLIDQHYGCSRMGDIYGPRHPVQRELYDFFDDQALQISIGPPVGDTPSLCFWDYDIVIPEAEQKAYLMDGDYGYKNRVEAEEAAFTRAFELLEKNLKRWGK